MPADLASVQAAVNADPAVQAALKQYESVMAVIRKENLSGQKLVNDPRVIAARQAVGTVLTSAKQRFGLPEDYQINYDGSVQHISDMTPNKLALLIGGTLATAGLASGAGGGSSATSVGSSPGAAGNLGDAAALAGGESVTPAATLGSVYGAAVPAASVAAPAAAVAGPAAAATSNIWSKIIPTAISGIGSLVGAINSADASKTAAQIQSDSALQAAKLSADAQANTLAFQKQQWADTQANMAPWLKTGQSAITTLGDLMGFNGKSQSNGGYPVQASATSGQPSRPVTNLNGAPLPVSSYYGAGGAKSPQDAPKTSGPAYVRIAWPDGSGDTVPSSSLPQYQLLGATVNA